VRWAVVPWPASEGAPTALDLTAAVHAATSLRRLPGREGQESFPAREAPLPAPRLPALEGMFELPKPAVVEAEGLGVIAARRSVRRFARTPVPAPALAALLQAMTAPAPLLSSAVRIDVLTPAAQGLPPAAWRHEAPTRTLHRRVAHDEGLRARARAAALEQDVIGEAALVFVLSLDRQVLMADPLGPARGWRHGFIEAGLVGERLYLAAPALGLGVCAVGAFYDDEASALVGVDPAHEWVVHFAAVGIPA
jgi:nitroreductase